MNCRYLVDIFHFENIYYLLISRTDAQRAAEEKRRKENDMELLNFSCNTEGAGLADLEVEKRQTDIV